ncbi:MAG: ATP-dependent helicase [Candidatus Gastranaerophilaceae bacterium]
MLLQGTISSEKTQKLVENYAKLLNSGVDSSKILVILQNSSKKKQFIDQTLEKLTVDVIEKLQVYSFFGLVYNTISDNWASIENKIPDTQNTKIIPNLTGLEISQFIMKEIISEIKFEGYNSKKSLLHQLFRRYSLIVQNNLSDEDVKWRSEEVLKESFAPDAKIALDEFKKKTLEARALDYLRQSLIFNYVYQTTGYFSKIEYLIVDDADEITPICLDFIKFLKPQLKDVFVAYDEAGGSRLGYLSADKTAGFELEKLFEEKDAKSEMAEEAEQNSILVTQAPGHLATLSKRAGMLDSGINEIKKLINNGIKPSEIAIVTPIVDDMLRFCLKDNLKSDWANIIFLSGSEKIIQNPIVLASLTILKLCGSELKEDLSEFDIRAVLDFLQIPLRHCKEILENFEKTKEFIKFEFSLPEYNEKYEKFLELLKNLGDFEKLSEQVYEIYEKFVDIQNYTAGEITKFSFFIKQLEDFENIFGNIKKSEIINQIENSIISENPYSTLEIKDNDLVVATPQKIIDNQIQTKYQFWFDVSSDEWIKNDTGPLYNSWVFQAGWDKPEYTLQDNIELSRQKTKRVLRKLTLCAKENIFTYASLFDGSGMENFCGIEKYLSHNEVKTVIKAKPFTPRDDQEPVLKYKNGKMAISAVPGAGKTTILLALVIKLLNDRVNPENIFVLTYMDSAARNFRERIQNASQEFSQLPNISTIHGLALKILKENSNFERLGLNADFEICDETQRSRILREIGGKFDIKKTELEDFDRAVSILKIGGNGGLNEGLKPKPTDKKLAKFLEFFKEYKAVLQANNLIDYDDMLLFSVKLLEENPDILDYYQEICRYIIEDEAQDSSAIQQRLIELLSAKHKNLIRCGDINQAITTTFSNADTEGFRKFIKESQIKVGMDRSQRCTKDVWTLANSLISHAEAKPETKNAFYKIFMRPVEGKNPQETKAITSIIFENEFVEKNYVLKQIKTLLTKNPKATVGILLRGNYQVASWTKFINNSGMKTITRSECLEQKGIFRTIFAVMKIILDPFNNENIAENYDTLAELGHYKSNLYQIIKNCPKPFVQMNADDIENVDLAEFYWDLIYWLSFSSLPAEELAIKIGLHYYDSEIEKSNVYLISTLIKRLGMSYKKYSTLIERLGELAKKPNLSGFKFFSEEDKSDREFLAGKVQIMTLHKSKGDEFDFVFLPEMTEKNLPLSFENVSLKKNAGFMEDVRELNPAYPAKTDDELREFLLAENLRLFYVAVTRAKRKLFITANKSAKYSKVPEPSVIFKALAVKGGKSYE